MIDSSPRILVVGGLDPCGGAGITADARMAQALDVHALTVATCLTVQNRFGMTRVEAVASDLLGASLDAAMADGEIAAIKLGLCATPSAIGEVLARAGDVPLIVDPVLSATSGGLSSSSDLIDGYREALPRITLLTPNLPELERLAPGGVADLLDAGCGHVLIKGGHGDETSAVVEDRLVTRDGELVLRHPRLEVGPVHGTGCALATAIAARIAAGADLDDACRGAVNDLVASLSATSPSADGLPAPLRIRASDGANR